MSLSCCPHMWRVKDNVNTNTSIVSTEAPTVHCSALTDIFPLSNVTDLTMQNDRVAYADVRNLWPVSMATQLLPVSRSNLSRKYKFVSCCRLLHLLCGWRRNYTKWFVRHHYNYKCQLINSVLYMWLALMKMGRGACKIWNKKGPLSNPEFLATFYWFTSCTTALHHQGNAL